MWSFSGKGYALWTRLIFSLTYLSLVEIDGSRGLGCEQTFLQDENCSLYDAVTNQEYCFR